MSMGAITALGFRLVGMPRRRGVVSTRMTDLERIFGPVAANSALRSGDARDPRARRPARGRARPRGPRGPEDRNALRDRRRRGGARPVAVAPPRSALRARRRAAGRAAAGVPRDGQGARAARRRVRREQAGDLRLGRALHLGRPVDVSCCPGSERVTPQPRRSRRRTARSRSSSRRARSCASTRRARSARRSSRSSSCSRGTASSREGADVQQVPGSRHHATPVSSAERASTRLPAVVREVLEQVGARQHADGLPARATTTAFVRPVSVAKTSSSESPTSTAGSGGCIAFATSSCSASGFLKTRSSRSRSWSEPITSASESTCAVAHDRELRDRVALHRVDRLADLLVRRDRHELRHVGLLDASSSGAARRRSARGARRSTKPCSSIQLSS